MITQRQIDFRNELSAPASVGWYNGYLHIVLIYAMGAAVAHHLRLAPSSRDLAGNGSRCR